MATLIRPAGTTGHVVFRGADDSRTMNLSDLYQNARAADLYRAFTDADRLAAWTGGSASRGADGALLLEIPDLGTSAKLVADEPNTRIAFAWRQRGWTEGATVVNLAFHPTLRACLLTITHTGLAETDVDAARALWSRDLLGGLHRGLVRDGGPVVVLSGGE